MVKEIDVNDEFTKEVFAFLEEIRKGGRINMFGSGQVLCEAYGFEPHVAKAFLVKWMETYQK